MGRLKITACILFLLFLTCACGYRFAGGGALPADAQRVFITIFDNRTSEIGVENVLASELANEFTTLGPKGVLVSSRQGADAELSGVISTVRTYTVSRAGESTSSERRVVLTVAARMTSPTGRVLWRADALSATEVYRVAADKQTTDANKRVAIRNAANLVAEEIYNRLTSDF